MSKLSLADKLWILLTGIGSTVLFVAISPESFCEWLLYLFGILFSSLGGAAHLKSVENIYYGSKGETK
jgi:hypothetical protein